MSAPSGASLVATGRRISRKSFQFPRYRRNLWLLLASLLVTFIGLGVQALVINLYLVNIGFHDDFLGLFSFANTAGIGLAALLAGGMASKFGARRILLAAIVVFAGSTAALALSKIPVVLLAVAVVNGASLAHLFVPSATYVMDNAEPDQRSTAFAGYFTAQSVALVLGSYLGGALPAALSTGGDISAFGYSWTILASAALAVIGVAPMYFADDTRATGSAVNVLRPSSGRDQRQQMRRDIAWNVGSSTVMAASMGFILPFINVYFETQLGADTVQIGIIFAVASSAMVVASIAGPSIGRRLGIVPTIVVCRLLTVPTIVGLAYSPSLQIGAFLYIARTLVTNATWPVDNTFMMELVSPDLRATLAALRSSSWNFAWAVASGLAGLMIVRFGFPSIFIASGIFMVVGCGTFYFAFRNRAPSPSLAATESVVDRTGRRVDAAEVNSP